MSGQKQEEKVLRGFTARLKPVMRPSSSSISIDVQTGTPKTGIKNQIIVVV